MKNVFTYTVVLAFMMSVFMAVSGEREIMLIKIASTFVVVSLLVLAVLLILNDKYNSFEEQVPPEQVPQIVLDTTSVDTGFVGLGTEPSFGEGTKISRDITYPKGGIGWSSVSQQVSVDMVVEGERIGPVTAVWHRGDVYKQYAGERNILYSPIWVLGDSVADFPSVNFATDGKHSVFCSSGKVYMTVGRYIVVAEVEE